MHSFMYLLTEWAIGAWRDWSWKLTSTLELIAQPTKRYDGKWCGDDDDEDGPRPESEISTRVSIAFQRSLRGEDVATVQIVIFSSWPMGVRKKWMHNWCHQIILHTFQDFMDFLNLKNCTHVQFLHSIIVGAAHHSRLLCFYIQICIDLYVCSMTVRHDIKHNFFSVFLH